MGKVADPEVTNVGSQALATVGGWARNWRRLSRDSKMVLVIALLAASVAAAIVVILWTSSRQYVPLYGKQELYDKANILEMLEQMEFAYRLDGGSGDVMVREDQLAKARIGLAAQGIRAALPAGLEGLDNLSALGTSQFMESARYLHAIEGELARTIIALDAVRSARVHIAKPERTLFIGRSEQKPTASVMVDLAGGRSLATEQVEAIVNLVAGSVPGMQLESVAVIDQSGQLLSAGLFDRQGLGRLSLQQLDFTRRLEQLVAERASNMLYPLFGSENFRVQVAAEMDFSSVEETRKTLDDTPVLVSESSSLESDIDALAMGIPGALSNRPPMAEAAEAADEEETAPAKPESTRRREELDNRFEVGTAVTHTRQQQARLRNLSVSVLLNSQRGPEGGWQQAQLDSLAEMLKKAVGFNAARGDEFSLTSFSFTPEATAVVEPKPMEWWHDPVWQNYLRYAIGGLLVLALIQFGVRPLVQHLVRTQGRELPPQSGKHNVIDAADQGDELAVTLTGAGATALPASEASQLADLPPPGSELEVQLKHLRLLVDKESARVTEVIKQWTHNHAG